MEEIVKDNALSSIELENCKFVKTVLMILVVMYHSLAFWLPGGWFNCEPVQKSYTLGYIASWLNSFLIYTFFLVSGYIFYAMKYEKLRYKGFVEFAIKKVQRLLVPYVFVNVCWVIPVYCYFFRPSPKVVFEKFLLMESPAQLWFLVALFVVFMIFYPLSDYIKQHGVLTMLNCPRISRHE